MLNRVSRFVALVAVGAFLLGGCSSSKPPTSSAPTAYSGGDISEAQYVAIITAIQQCMSEKGFSVTPVEMRPDKLTYTFWVEGGSPGDTSAMEDRLECEARFNLPEAEVAFQAQHMLKGAEREAVLADFIDCMTEAGVAGLTGQDTFDVVASRIDALREGGGDDTAALACLDQFAPRLFGPYQ